MPESKTDPKPFDPLAFATAIAKANGHPDPAAWAARVLNGGDPLPEPEPEPEAPAEG